MADYLYEATDAGGKIERGVIEAADVASAIEQIVQRNLSVTSIALQNEAAAKAEKQRLSLQRNLSKLAERRGDWIAAIQAMCDELPAGATRREMQEISKQLDSPQFDQPALALLEAPSIVPLLPLLAEREYQSNSENCLQEWLSDTLKQREQSVELRKRWMYPAALMTFAIILLIVFSFFLVPIFREMYDEFGLVLPPPTRLTFWIADQISTYLVRTLIVLALVLVALVPAVRFWRRRSLANRLFGRLLAGTSSNLRSMSLLASNLADMLSLGIPISQAVRIAGRASRNYFYERAALELSAQIGMSQRLDSDLTSRVLPPSLLFALRAESGNSPSLPLLRAIAEIYQDRSRNRLDLLTNMLPIFAIVAIGCGVGFVVISLFMPLVSLVTSLA